jgi:hypothetical protein
MHVIAFAARIDDETVGLNLQRRFVARIGGNFKH